MDLNAAFIKQHYFPFRRFSPESPMRCNSFYDHFTSQMYDDDALCAHQKSYSAGGKPPKKLDADQLTIAQHICAVLHTIQVPAKVIEGRSPRFRAGLYLPAMKAIQRQMEPDMKTLLPQGAGEFGPIESRQFILPEEMHPLAQRLKAFLLEDCQ